MNILSLIPSLSRIILAAPANGDDPDEFVGPPAAADVYVPPVSLGELLDDVIFEQLCASIELGDQETLQIISELDPNNPVLDRFLDFLERSPNVSLRTIERFQEYIYSARFERLGHSTPHALGTGFKRDLKEDAKCLLVCEMNYAERRENILALMVETFETSPDVRMRHYILRLARALGEITAEKKAGYMDEPVKRNEIISGALMLAEMGLRDSELRINLEALGILNSLRSVESRLVQRIEEEAFPGEAISSNDWDDASPLVERYFYNPSPWHSRALSIVFRDLTAVGSSSLSIDGFRPLHSLADYNPDPDYRSNVLERKVEQIRQTADRSTVEKILQALAPLTVPEGEEPQIRVLEIESGERILIQGHHRVAALIVAASEGLIPPEFLDQIPVELYRYTGTTFPPAWVRHFLFLGNLQWTDLFPAGMI
ncbi:MAG: hypothetical protein Q7S00_03445, partial [bacterium]|nr:hypothetical protein [bacterium]